MVGIRREKRGKEEKYNETREKEQMKKTKDEEDTAR